jgi:hypothetical protein
MKKMYAVSVSLALAFGVVPSLPALSQDPVAAFGTMAPMPELATDRVAAVDPSFAPRAFGRPTPSKLLREMAADLGKFSAYAAPADFPRFSRVSHEELASHACGGPCRLVRAAFVPGEGIYVEASLDPEHDAMDRSIVFHEYVHFVQQQSGTYAQLDDCARMRAEELEAYALQNRYLAASGRQPIYLPPNAFRCD